VENGESSKYAPTIGKAFARTAENYPLIPLLLAGLLVGIRHVTDLEMKFPSLNLELPRKMTFGK